MKRRLIQLGQSTLLVSLPTEFVSRFGLKKGMEVDVAGEDSCLIMRAFSGETSKKTVVLENVNYSQAWYAITAAYITGFSEIEIRFSGPIWNNRENKKELAIDSVARIIQSIIGMEILRQGKDFCSLKEVSAPRAEELKEIISRIWSILVVLADEVRDPLLRSRLHVHEEQLNRLVFFCLRVISRIGSGSRMNSLALFGILSRLEEAGDSFKLLSEVCKGKDVVLDLLHEAIIKTRDAVLSGKTVSFVQAWNARAVLKSRLKNSEAHFVIRQMADNLMDVAHLSLSYTSSG